MQLLTARAASIGIESDEGETDPQLALKCALLELLRRSKLPKLKLLVRLHPLMTSSRPFAGDAAVRGFRRQLATADRGAIAVSAGPRRDRHGL